MAIFICETRIVGSTRQMPARRSRAVLLALAIAALIACDAHPVRAGALLGPVTFGQTFPNDWFQDYDNEFRWSFKGSNQKAIVVQFDYTFVQAFGANGVAAVKAAFNTWSVQSGNVKFVVGKRDNLAAPGNNQYDLESVAMHEIGHALGLHHPDEAAAFNRNFDRQLDQLNVDLEFPWLQNAAVNAGVSVMQTAIAPGDKLRDLRQDDFAGVRYLYDAKNKNAFVKPEPNVLGGVAGMGRVLFDPIGQDDDPTQLVPPPIDEALAGTSVGTNIDIFAANFIAIGPMNGQQTLPTDVDVEGGARARIVRPGNGADPPLAFTDIQFSLNPGTDGPGIFDGTPENGQAPDNMIVAGADIYFNTDPNLMWYATPPPKCENAPESCRVPVQSGKARILIKDTALDTKDQLTWKWGKGAATTKAEYGDPLATNAYELCVYDASGLVMEATAEVGGICGGKSCWTESSTGFKFKDKEETPDGLLQLQLKQGADGLAKIIVKGKGANLGLPDLSALASPVTVQLKSDGPVCWGAVYTFPAQVNTATEFKDIAD